MIAAVPGVAPTKWLRIWDEARRGARIELRQVPADGVVASLDAGVDVVFARLPVDDAFNTVRLWTETPVAVAPRDHPIKVVDAVTEVELADETLVEGQDEAALDLVAAGAGVARMPQSVFRQASRRDLVARPISDAEPTQIALVWPRDLPEEREQLVQLFVGIVRGRGANSSR